MRGLALWTVAVPSPRPAWAGGPPGAPPLLPGLDAPLGPEASAIAEAAPDSPAAPEATVLAALFTDELIAPLNAKSATAIAPLRMPSSKAYWAAEAPRSQRIYFNNKFNPPGLGC